MLKIIQLFKIHLKNLEFNQADNTIEKKNLEQRIENEYFKENDCNQINMDSPNIKNLSSKILVNKENQIKLHIPPEGTTKYREYLKTGFYIIGINAYFNMFN